MRCLYCGNELALLKKLTGGGEFCSEAHRQKYQEEYNRLALGRLLHAQGVADEQRPPLGGRLPALTRPVEPLEATTPVVPEISKVRELPSLQEAAALSNGAAHSLAAEPMVAVDEITYSAEQAPVEDVTANEPDPAEAGFVVDRFEATPANGSRQWGEPIILAGETVRPQNVDQKPVAQLSEPGTLALPNLEQGWNCAVRIIEKNLEPREFAKPAPFVRIPLERARPKGLETEEASIEVELELSAKPTFTPWSFEAVDFSSRPPEFSANMAAFVEAVGTGSTEPTTADLSLPPFSDVPEGEAFEAAPVDDEPGAQPAVFEAAAPIEVPRGRSIAPPFGAPIAPQAEPVSEVSDSLEAGTTAAASVPVGLSAEAPQVGNIEASPAEPAVSESIVEEPGIKVPGAVKGSVDEAATPIEAAISVPETPASDPVRKPASVMIDFALFGDFDDVPAPTAPLAAVAPPAAAQPSGDRIMAVPDTAWSAAKEAPAQPSLSLPIEREPEPEPAQIEAASAAPKIPKAASESLEVPISIVAPKAAALTDMQPAAPPPSFRITGPVLESVAIRPKMVFGERPELKTAPKPEGAPAKQESVAAAERAAEASKQSAAATRRDQRRGGSSVKPGRPGVPKPLEVPKPAVVAAPPETRTMPPAEIKAPAVKTPTVPATPAKVAAETKSVQAQAAPAPAGAADPVSPAASKAPATKPSAEIKPEAAKPKPAAAERVPSSFSASSLHLDDNEVAIGPIGMSMSKKVAVGAGLALALALGGFFLKSSFASKSPTVTAATGVDAVGPSLVSGSGGWASDWAGLNAKRQISFLRSSANLADYRILFQGEIQNKTIGWIYRAKDPKNFYMTRIEMVKPGLTPRVVVAHYVYIDGDETARVETPLPFPVHIDTVYKVRTDVYGNRFKTYIQDKLVESWTDDRLKSGGFGLVTERADRSQVRLIQLFELRAGQ